MVEKGKLKKEDKQQTKELDVGFAYIPKSYFMMSLTATSE